MISAETMKAIRDDWLKVGIMMIVSHILNGGSVQDQRWMQSSLYTLLGFTAYQLVTSRLDTSFAGNYKPIADDWMKVGTMLVVSRLLARQPLDQVWLQSSLYTLLGFTAYHLVTKKFIKTDSLGGIQKDVADDWLKVGTMLGVSRALGGQSLQDNQWQRESLNTLFGFSTYDVVKPTLEQLL